MSDRHYYIFYKPYGVLSQFSREAPHHRTLADYMDVPKTVYPVGRLDKDSEGLLLLTDDPVFKMQILNPKEKTPKTYWSQVEGEISEEAIRQLQVGVDIKIKKGRHTTLPCVAKKINAPDIEERDPPIRSRKHIPTSWVALTIVEGKNRQVRKMCAGVGFPCLRLIRVSINGLAFPDLRLGDYRTLTTKEIKQLQA